MIRIPNFAYLTIAVAFSLTSNSLTMQKKNAIKMWQIWHNISSTYIVSDIYHLCMLYDYTVAEYSWSVANNFVSTVHA
jgi:hypothetical protein